MPLNKDLFHPRLSKSKYILGLQCEKALWLAKNRTDIVIEVDAATQANFDMGNEIGALARKCFAGGEIIPNAHHDIKKAVNLTQALIADGQSVIFEAAAYSPSDGAFCLVDILQKVSDPNAKEAEWHLIEVKNSTSVKEYHLNDISFQYYVFSECGYNITKCFIMHIDSSYVRKKRLVPKKLFKLEDVTDIAMANKDLVKQKVLELNEIVSCKTIPDISINTHCFHPFSCSYMPLCWENVPAYSIFNIFSKNQAFDMAKELNTYDIKSIPEQYLPSGNKGIDAICYQKNEVYVDKEAIANWLSCLKYPLYFLDYETIMYAIPLFENTSPYQQIPFQFSLHVQASPSASLEHFEFIHKQNSDPREEFTKALTKLCGHNGSIIVYNQAFEMTRNKELALHLPHYAKSLYKINERVVDLMIPFYKRWLYSPKQQSSASIKSVLPAFTTLSYEHMEIANGQDAMDAYTAFAKGVYPTKDLPKLWQNLCKYCELDTLAMVELLKVLRNVLN